MRVFVLPSCLVAMLVLAVIVTNDQHSAQSDRDVLMFDEVFCVSSTPLAIEFT